MDMKPKTLLFRDKLYEKYLRNSCKYLFILKQCFNNGFDIDKSSHVVIITRIGTERAKFLFNI